MPRKGENIYKRKDGRWEGRYIKGRTLDGKALYGYVYAPSYREAKAKQADAVSVSGEKKQKYPKNREEKSFSESSRVLLRDLAAFWFSSVVPQIKESTAVKYTNLWNCYIAPELGNLYVQEITHSILEGFCSRLLMSGGRNHNGLSPKTVSDTLTLLRNILHFGKNMGCICAADGSSVCIRQPSRQLRVLTQQEQCRLCEYLMSNMNMKNLGILVSLYTGIRVGEICALQWEDISFSEKTIFVHQTMQRIQTGKEDAKTKIIVTPPKSSSSVRIIPLPEDLETVMRNCSCRRKGYFLTGSESKYVEPRTMQNQFKRAAESCVIENVNYHVLRHTFATRCIELGFDVKTLSELLGHSSVNITMNRYVHPSMELKRDHMQRLSLPFAVK